tara:strand:+ start:307 stop:426 length:120 start_codon:yes stop_codon:yes gene_type:complete
MNPEELNIDWVDDDEFIIVDLKINGIWYSGTLDASEEDE